MITKILTATILILGTAAFAAQTQWTLIPAQGQHEMAPYLGSLAASFDESNGSQSATGTGTIGTLGFSYHYGIFSNHAIGLETSFSSSETKTTYLSIDNKSTSSGVDNMLLDFKGMTDLKNVTLFYSLGYLFKLETEKYNDLLKEGNMAQGQNAFTMQLGAYLPINDLFTLGGQIQYKKNSDGERTRVVPIGPDTTTKLSKGDALIIEAFAELNVPFHPNFSFGKESIYSTDTVSSGIASAESGKDMFFIYGGGRWDLNPNIQLIPQIRILSLAQKYDYYDKFSIVEAKFGARFLF